MCAGGSGKSCLHRHPLKTSRESARRERERAVPVLPPHRAHRAVSTLLVRTSDLAPRDRTSRLVKTRLTRVVPITCTSRRDADVSRGSDDCRLARPSHFITLTITHCTFCRCAARGPVPDRRAPALGLACLCSYVFIIMELYRRVNLSTTRRTPPGVRSVVLTRIHAIGLQHARPRKPQQHLGILGLRSPSAHFGVARRDQHIHPTPSF